MFTVFISHSAKDNATAEEMADWLTRNGHSSIFLDFHPEKGIPAGRNWERELYEQIRNCRAMIFLCSNASMQSRWCFVEVAHARALGKHVIPILIEPCGTELPFGDLQYVDFTRGKDTGLGRLQRALAASSGPAAKWAPGRSPFPGLSPFEEADAPAYFGRERDVASTVEALSAIQRLRGSGLLLMVGASGAGKSSLVRAGLIPRLRAETHRFIPIGPFRPRAAPIAELAFAVRQAFGGTSVDTPEDAAGDSVTMRLAGDMAAETALATVADELRSRRGQRDASVLVVVDQFEEVLQAAPVEANRFLDLLRHAAAAPGSQVIVLATLRSDFLATFHGLPFLEDLDYGQMVLSPLSRAGREEAILRPLELAGAAIEPALARTLTDETAAAGSLPLLAFTLQQMFQRAAGNPLRLADYETFGGIGGAIQRAAESALPRTISAEEAAALRLSLIALAGVSEEGRFIRRSVPRASLPPPAAALLECLVRARVLVSSGDSDESTVEVAHEAVFEAWERLARWLEESRDDLVLLQHMRRAAAFWEKGGRLADDLWRGERLGKAVAAFDRLRTTASEDEIAFIAESTRRDNEEGEQRRLRRIYREVADSALRQYARQFLEGRIGALTEQIKSFPETFNHNKQQLELEVSFVKQFLGQGGRWHPSGPKLVQNLGAYGDYNDVYRFPCCDVQVISGDAMPSRFRDDGCQEAPHD